MAKITILLPVFNGLPYIKETIASIFAQSNEDWCLSVSDNASTDGTYEYLKSLNDPRVRLSRHGSNIGAAANWAHLFETTDSEYAVLFGADDIMLPNFLALLSSCLDQNKEIGFVFGSCDLIDGDGKFTNDWDVPDEIIESKDLLQRLMHRNEVNISSCMIRLNLAKSRGLKFDRQRTLLFDWAMWIDFCQLFEKFETISAKVVKYRKHSASLTGRNQQSPVWNFDLFGMMCDRMGNSYAAQMPHSDLRIIASSVIWRFLKRGEFLSARKAASCLIRCYKPAEIMKTIIGMGCLKFKNKFC